MEINERHSNEQSEEKSPVRERYWTVCRFHACSAGTVIEMTNKGRASPAIVGFIFLGEQNSFLLNSMVVDPK